MKRSESTSEKELLELLSSGLSEDEIQRVLACALKSLDKAGLDRLAAMLGEETGNTLRRLLASFEGGGRAPEPGPGKVGQEWDNAWSDWGSLVFDSQSETGKYVAQDHHWEQPYFSPSSLADDLEPIATRMRKLLSRVFEEDLDPGFGFAEALKENVEDIGSGLPAWLEPFACEGFHLGPEATACLLEWEWLAAKRDGKGAFGFADKIRWLEASCDHLWLDGDTLKEFVLKLEASDRDELRKGMVENRRSGRWAPALESARSAWSYLYRELCSQGDAPRYLESCREGISQDWELALPVVDDCCASEAFEAAVPVIEEAFCSMLDRRERKWDPRTELLVRESSASYRADRIDSVLRLLDGWRKGAEALGQEETVRALGIQTALCRDWADWDAALKAFRRISYPKYAGLCGRLFAEWRSFVAEESLGHPTGRDGSRVTWVHALADAARGGDCGPDSFQGFVRDWLKEAERGPKTLERNMRALEMLTLELDQGSRLQKASAMLHRLLSGRSRDDTALGASRRRWLERLAGPDLFSEVLEFWRRNTARLVPDPAHVRHAHYDRCAEWLRALFELDPEACRKLVRGWTTRHRRRRNLWIALRKLDLPVD